MGSGGGVSTSGAGELIFESVEVNPHSTVFRGAILCTFALHTRTHAEAEFMLDDLIENS